jgi:DNA-directed RNA polymerase specialized sigma24 family protein
MVRSTASTRQPPAGGLGGASELDELLAGLRRGERDCFVRYFDLFRAPVYGFAFQLLHDEAAAAVAAVQSLSAAFRRVTLFDDGSDLEALTYRCALDACQAYVAAMGDDTAAGSAGGLTLASSNAASSHIDLALDSLETRQRAALLLHDVQGMSAARLAVVFSLTAEAAGALLFRSRTEFRDAFAARAAHARGGACRQAEEAVAGTVGLGFSPGELERLRSHAAYCRPCRRAMKGWPAGAFGLALALEQAPPPKALAAPAGFATASVAVAAGAGGGGSWIARILRPVGRALKSRPAAYVLAAACLTVAAGAVLHQQGVGPSVLFESVGPAVRLIKAPAAAAHGSSHSPTQQAASTKTSSASSRALAGVQPPPVAAAPVALVSSAAAALPQVDSAENVADSGGARSAPAPSARSAAASVRDRAGGRPERRVARSHGHSGARAFLADRPAQKVRDVHRPHGAHKVRRTHTATGSHRTHGTHKAHKGHKAWETHPAHRTHQAHNGHVHQAHRDHRTQPARKAHRAQPARKAHRAHQAHGKNG